MIGANRSAPLRRAGCTLPLGCTFGCFFLLLCGGAIAIVLRDIKAVSPAAALTGCQTNLKQIGLALNNYCSAEMSYPPAMSLDASGQPFQGWRGMVLHFIEGMRVVDDYDANLPWHAPKNMDIARKPLNAFICPASEERAQPTSYLAVAGPGFLFDGTNARRPEEITDGTDKTIAFVEVLYSDIAWNEPHDLTWAEFLKRYKERLLSDHRDGFNVLFVDGSVRLLPYDLDERTLRALFTIAGGEDLKAMGFER